MNGAVLDLFLYGVFVALYLAVAALFCLHTVLENHRDARRMDAWYLAGLALCLFWPLLLLILPLKCLHGHAPDKN